jgi:hypothetical protein
VQNDVWLLGKVDEEEEEEEEDTCSDSGSSTQYK